MTEHNSHLVTVKKEFSIIDENLTQKNECLVENSGLRKVHCFEQIWLENYTQSLHDEVKLPTAQAENVKSEPESDIEQTEGTIMDTSHLVTVKEELSSDNEDLNIINEREEHLIEDIMAVRKEIHVKPGNENNFEQVWLQSSTSTLEDDKVEVQVKKEEKLTCDSNPEIKRICIPNHSSSQEVSKDIDPIEPSLKPGQNDEKKERRKKNTCEQCGKCFPSAYKLGIHLRVHTGERPYACDTCDKTFTQLSGLQKHRNVHSGERKYKCDVCGKGFNQLVHLQKHMRTHIGEKPYKCNLCTESFEKSGELKSHQVVHNGLKKYKCDICDKGFMQLTYLQAHIRKHSEEKPYKCDICSKAFLKPENLKSHQEVHTGGKKYKCLVCGKAFSQSGYFQIHRRRHMGIKPYKCHICGKAFTTLGDLKHHQVVHTGEKKYECDVCHKKFAWSSYLGKHKKRYHS